MIRDYCFMINIIVNYNNYFYETLKNTKGENSIKSCYSRMGKVTLFSLPKRSTDLSTRLRPHNDPSNRNI